MRLLLAIFSIAVPIASRSVLLKCGSYEGPGKKIVVRSLQYAQALQQCCERHEEEWVAADRRLRHFIGEKVFCQCLNELPSEALMIYPSVCTETKFMNAQVPPKETRRRRGAHLSTKNRDKIKYHRHKHRHPAAVHNPLASSVL